MTREEAIKRFLDLRKMSKKAADEFEETFPRQSSNWRKDVELYDKAIAALLEQSNRTDSDTVKVVDSDQFKGCKLCNSEWFDITVQTRDPDDMYVFSSDPVIGAMFCPLCGRRLEEV